MTDEELAELGRRYEVTRERAAKYEERRKRIAKKIVQEMEARGSLTIESHGVRVHRTIQRRTAYNFAGLAEELSRRVINQLRPDTIDPNKLSRMVQAGEIPLALVERHSHEYVHSDYPSISNLKES